MLQEGDRRVEGRRIFHDAVQVFRDGHRFEAVPEDISIGGMFLKTPVLDDMRPGEVMGVLLDAEAGFEPPLFLYGRVVRVRRNGNTGVGLRWERAGTTGSADDLASALELLFARPASGFLKGVLPVAGSRLRHAYDFPRPAPADGTRRDPLDGGRFTARFFDGQKPAAPLSRPIGRVDGPLGLAVSDAELDGLDVKVVHDAHSRQGRNFKRAFDVDAGIVEPTPTAPGSRVAGPADDDDDDEDRRTPSIVAETASPQHRTSHASRRVPVRVEGVMTVARIEVPVVVTGLSLGSAFAESPLAPLGRSARVGLRLDLPRRDDLHQMWLDCAVERIHEGEYGTPPGVELKILSFDEPEQRDELARILESAKVRR